MNADQYNAYKATVESFFEREGIQNLFSDAEQYEEGCIEPHFSWVPCEVCRRRYGGDRYYCSGYNPTTREVQTYDNVCTDCYYYAEYGQLDDETMLQIARSVR